MYNVFKQADDGAFVYVASRGDLVAALQLISSLEAHWPGPYAIRDSHGNDVTAGLILKADAVGACAGPVRGF